ncbi:hypothetical protein Fmac_026443 [Flemingia macrophylla]|uniref:Myb/SANT-like domain-containing protein n=1 Tax=Flemingia macrophylla TaxID=520843 RepID=A0ABD1LEW6_9FABA
MGGDIIDYAPSIIHLSSDVAQAVVGDVAQAVVGSGVVVGGASTASYGGLSSTVSRRGLRQQLACMLVLTQTGDFIFSDDSSDDSRRQCPNSDDILRRVSRTIMSRGKGIAADSSIAVREFTKWTDDMDFRSLTAMLDEARLGNRVDGSWTTQAYNNIVESLRQTGKKVLRTDGVRFTTCSNGLSGFAWDESTRRFSAEPEVWDDLVMSKPSAAKWRTNAIRYYDLMEELWGADRATGHMARTARQTRTNIGTSSFRVDLNDDFDNIPEEQPFHPGFDTSYRSPPHVDSYIPVMELNQYHLLH